VKARDNAWCEHGTFLGSELVRGRRNEGPGSDNGADGGEFTRILSQAAGHLKGFFFSAKTHAGKHGFDKPAIVIDLTEVECE
jgi:hypothetical protein